jgi:hypothetical protein
MNFILILILVTLSICCANEIKRAKEDLRKFEKRSHLENNETVSKNSSVKAVLQQKLMAPIRPVRPPVRPHPEPRLPEEPDEKIPHVPHGHNSYGDSVEKISVNYLLIISGLFILIQI